MSVASPIKAAVRNEVFMIRSEKLTMHGRKGLESAESQTRTVGEGSRT
jgi:hypothetical protein